MFHIVQQTNIFKQHGKEKVSTDEKAQIVECLEQAKKTVDIS